MKKQVLTLLFAAAGIGSYAQCDKKNILTSSSTEFLNSNLEVQRTKEETTTVEYDSKEIVITPGDNRITGTINSVTCDWKTPYKAGKTVMKTTLAWPNGQSRNATLTIENKDSKIYFLLEFDEMPDRKTRLTADTFEEKK